jgi:hypothetical protein
LFQASWKHSGDRQILLIVECGWLRMLEALAAERLLGAVDI